MTDPKVTHQMEQMLAAMLSIGAALGQLYKGLIEEGTPVKAAIAITSSYARGLADAQWGRSMEGNEDLDDETP